MIIKISSVFSRNLAKREFSVQVFLKTDIVRTPRFSIFKKADQRIGPAVMKKPGMYISDFIITKHYQLPALIVYGDLLWKGNRFNPVT